MLSAMIIPPFQPTNTIMTAGDIAMCFWLICVAMTDRRQRAPPELRPDVPDIARRRWQLLCHE